MTTGVTSAAIRPAKPSPIGTRTPWRTSSSMPLAADGDQVAGRLVEQQHGGRVDVEDLAHPFEQLDEQVGDVEMGQGRVGDRFDASQPFGVVQLR